ncbi:MAG TPA: DUF3618 domain-containing protein [Solirubrobacteraceae bacterium]|nr:DUF3618 domain-containing protein [Solirubrobacteraceae bacterium]
MAGRTPEEIRASIEQSRQELGVSIVKLRDEVAELTDWRAQVRRNQQSLMIGAAAAGFIIGGGVGATFNLLFGRRRRRR